ncbi:putative nuclease HARBI1 isoform X2 [Drosophila busckii]|uniref:putative nuclease HARBI1 isoform X2 n=1 Tax=Drosophila busckii TaxID=30019 RepID=UPI00083EDC8A|nr:putative nuclease HARBI1 isoform X2 [Drosophila busckii]
MKDIEVFKRFLNEAKYFRDFQYTANGRKSKGGVKIRRKRFNPLEELNEVEFRRKYRYTKENMRRIIEMLRDDLEVELFEPMKRNQVPIDLQILAAIRYFGGTEHNQLTAMAHGASRYIRMPATLSDKERIMRSFKVLSNMPQVIGAIVQTSVCLDGSESPPAQEEQLHLQVVSDAEYKIRDLDIHLSDELEQHTAPELFSLSRIKERFEQNEFRGRIILGNDTLACSSSLFTPVRCPKNKSEELYNHAHVTTFEPANRCINMLMRRFGILQSGLQGPFGFAKQTITALALLHNMAMDWSDQSIVAEGYLSSFMPHSLNSGAAPTTSEEPRNRKDFIKTHFSGS